MLGFSQTTYFQKHILALLISRIAANQPLPSQALIADELTQTFTRLITSASVSVEIKKLKQLGCLNLVGQGKWGTVGFNLVVPTNVVTAVQVWLGQERARKGLA